MIVTNLFYMKTNIFYYFIDHILQNVKIIKFKH